MAKGYSGFLVYSVHSRGGGRFGDSTRAECFEDRLSEVSRQFGEVDA